ncbi:MAG TPA: hypothetical protein PKM25_16600 [Candidatus Ozemobacteraceae bacterium]|nr:hypothetical protein [Candidatus Ozemobacteraceae bacterium]
MNKKTYIDSMNMLQFSDDFDEKTIEKMREAALQTPDDRHTASTKRSFRWKSAVLPMIGCAVTAIAIFVLPMLLNPGTVKETSIVTSAAVTESETSAAASTADAVSTGNETSMDIKAITVVDPKQYADVVTDGFLAEPGKVNFDIDVQRAIKDPATDGKYFFVDLFLVMDMSKTEIGKFEDYVYNGRTIAEWRVLTDLANETYPYNEYNGDMGGNVTREEYDAALAEAKTLQAEENQDAAIEEYLAAYDAIYPEIEALRIETLTAECERLQELGYDVRLYDTWTYYGDAQKKDQTILAGLFSKEDLLKLKDESFKPVASMVVSWVRNGDGIVGWDSSRWA